MPMHIEDVRDEGRSGTRESTDDDGTSDALLDALSQDEGFEIGPEVEERRTPANDGERKEISQSTHVTCWDVVGAFPG